MSKAGAGVIPFSVYSAETRFLFQKVFSGRKSGFLIDFGGGVGDGETARDCATREFIEETETMYFADDLAGAVRSRASVSAQIPIVASLFDETLAAHPDWWCRRHTRDPAKPKDWTTFFVKMPYRDLDDMNRAWRVSPVGQFKKRRELVWIAADELVAMYDFEPEKLWKRVRQLDGAAALVRTIQRTHHKSGR